MYSWDGDEHDLWDFEDEFYKKDKELAKEKIIQEREEEIKRLKEIVKENNEKLKKLQKMNDI